MSLIILWLSSEGSRKLIVVIIIVDLEGSLVYKGGGTAIGGQTD